MVALWMLYAALSGAAIVSMAALLETRVRGRRRLLWALVLVGVVAVPPALTLLPGGTGGGIGIMVDFGAIEPIVGAPGARVGSLVLASSARWGLDGALLVGWGCSTLVLLGVLTMGIRWTRARRRRWVPSTVDGVPVLLSTDVGPAVIGLLDPAIVVPRWVLDRPEEERRMILEHELQHLKARDPALLAGAFGLASLVPWNLPLWWAFLRFRDAVETDCDARVLATGLGAPARYARLLLDAGAHIGRPVPVGAGFGERTTSLERRVRAMLGLDRVQGWRGPATRLALVALMAIAACSLEVNINTGQADREPDAAAEPPAIDVREIPAPEAGIADATGLPEEPPRVPGAPGGGEGRQLEEAPTFTPFTVAPSIVNRDEVIQAMQAEYPPLLREAGIGGTVRIYFFIGEDGAVQKRILDRSSGHPALDEAAMRVAQIYRFTPALNRGDEVPVWVSFPITFQVK